MSVLEMGNSLLTIWAISPVTVNGEVGYIPMMEQPWSKRLREQMDAKGFTMKSLSAAAGQNETYIRDILQRNRTPTIDKFVRVAEALGVSASFLLGEAASANAPAERNEQHLRSALLAFGVDREDVGRAVSAVKVFVDDLDEQSLRPPLDDQSESASPRRVSTPSGKRARQSSS